ncbi:Uncharacterised protein [uncultured Clostridium sp.]|uniref:hypothetical protein n=1 Tax=uncultured Clostridium sp. TaxID=59620 RepID=UPI000821A101|nr:hypothetical protein [uncultured Clostridium sp.]SCJ52246.1 Uncharacterised protein [uncultured Clostridium sp.]
MYSKTETLTATNKTILALAGQLFQNTNIKVAKTDVTSKLDGGVLKAGTVLSKDGKYVDGSTVTHDKAFGLLYKDVDFNNSTGKETVSVLIFGFVKESELPEVIDGSAKSAMKMIQFL